MHSRAVETEPQKEPVQPAAIAIKPDAAAVLKAEPAVVVSTVPTAPFQDVSVTLPQRQDDSPLTLDYLEQRALANNPTLAQARAWIQAARGKRLQAGLPPNTVIGFAGNEMGTGGEAEQLGVFVGQAFIRGDKLQLSQAVVSEEILAAETAELIQQQRVITDVRLGFYEVLVAEQQNKAARELVDLAGQAVAAAQALLEAQEVGRIDVMRAQIQLQSEQLSQKRASVRLTAAWSRLIATLGMPAVTRGPLQGQIGTAVPSFNSDRLVARLLDESPELVVARINVERARRAVERAVAEPIPDLDLQAALQHDNATNGAIANLQLSFPIPWRNRNQGAIQTARAEVVAAERVVERVELDLRQRLATVYQRYSKAHYEVEGYASDGGILAKAAEVLDLVRRGYEAGELTYADLIMAQRTYSQTKLAYINSLGKLWSAVVEIDGLLLKGNLQQRSE